MMVSRLIFLFLFISSVSLAQKDLIVTQAGEEIRCKILEESSMRYSYAYINDRGDVLKTEIFKTLVSTFKKDYYPEDLLPNAKLFNSNTKSKNKKREDSVLTKRDVDLNYEDKAVSTVKEKPKQIVEKEEILVINETPVIKIEEKAVLVVKEKPKQVAEKEEIHAINATPFINDEERVVTPKTEKLKEVVEKGEHTVINELPIKKKEVPIFIPKEEDVKKVAGVKEELYKDNSNLKTECSTQSKETNIAEVVPVKVEKVKPIKNEFTNYLKYRVGIKGGLANLMKENTDKSEYGLYNEKLSRGGVYGVDAAIFLNDFLGLGVTYTSFQSKNSNDWFDFPRIITHYVKTGSLQDKVSQRFVGPTLLSRLALDYKTFIVATVSPGYYFFQNKRVEDELNLNIKGNTFGAAATLGIDFLIGDNDYGRDVIISFECGYNYGKLTKLNYGGTVGTQTLASPIDLCRFDFSVGLRFNRFPKFLR